VNIRQNSDDRHTYDGMSDGIFNESPKQIIVYRKLESKQYLAGRHASARPAK